MDRNDRRLRQQMGTARVLLLSAVMCLLAGPVVAQEENEPAEPLGPAGLWQAAVECPGGSIRFGLQLEQQDDQWTAWLINGNERIQVPHAEHQANRLTLEIPHYDSRIALKRSPQNQGWNGTWTKRRGADQWVELPITLTRPAESKPTPESREPFLGRWAVDFDSSDDPAVGIFAALGKDRVQGTFLTTTGDYRFLSGGVVDEQLELSCFDGAHAFLFRARRNKEGQLVGDFWSSDTWHESWTATRDDQAALPDAFRQTLVNQKVKLADFSFPNLEGKPTNLADEKFQGKARLIYVFGSWCPNCHDAAAFLSELDREYGERGLSILGLAFELTGDFERDAEQVRQYLERHECRYPVLIAGLADKAKASRSFPVLDRIRSYPTTLFIDPSGTIRHVHTGFSGPATGDAYEQLRRDFKKRIEAMLAEESP